MDSTIFNRRTLLGGGALVGLGALLAACGQQANNEAAATASAAPSETASASAAASDAASASASATPSPRVTRGYSGQSKAPDGEYRKADGYGPAQNVPKPRNEPAQYPETEEGLIHMMEDWVVAHNYGIQTGDCSYAKKYVSEDTEEYKFYEYIEALYQRGGWVIEGLDSYLKEGNLMYNQESKEYRVKTRRIWTTVMYFEPDGTGYDAMNKDKSDDTFTFVYRYDNGYWKIVSSEDA
ncbi:MAG: transposase [Rothia mucilaginosa]|uniref:DUF6318 family protein n=1 Tax=Rothia mucilaginosa TaxID=43675 RepID=UPI001CAF0ED1|nr:DUF6318 family protein [Rothia mucilaginosa]MBF1652648.1 transposase [Rothia mucilaginosa]